MRELLEPIKLGIIPNDSRWRGIAILMSCLTGLYELRAAGHFTTQHTTARAGGGGGLELVM